ncbi:MAG: biopolymer transporter ExbD [Sporomusaceae bacterium]|nr:biopolymer transporter ExbD [Sporomusaceae bacterium]
MKIHELRHRRSPKLMIIPMIDIIFFLLVFFMMSTLYMVDQQTISVRLPQAQTAKSDRPHSVAVTVTADNKILFDKEEIPFSLLGQRTKALLAAQASDDLVIILRSDKSLEYGKVVAVLDELKSAGAQRIAIATDRKGE